MSDLLVRHRSNLSDWSARNNEDSSKEQLEQSSLLAQSYNTILFFATMIQLLSCCTIKDFRKLKQSCFSASFPNVWLQFLICAIANQTHEDSLVRRKTDICVWLFATVLNAAAILEIICLITINLAER